MTRNKAANRLRALSLAALAAAAGLLVFWS